LDLRAFPTRAVQRAVKPGWRTGNAIAAVFARQANAKNVFVVDPDVDVFSDAQVEWALATRFQPRRDTVCGEYSFRG
jgi:UbiD family decarboxylase